MSVDDKNIAELARDTAAGITSLAANEIRLAAAELQESIEKSAGKFRGTIYGAALLIPGLTIALAGAALAVGSIDGVAEWLSFLVIGAVAIGAGYLMMKSGSAGIEPTIFFPDKTFKNLRRDAQTIKDAAT